MFVFFYFVDVWKPIFLKITHTLVPFRVRPRYNLRRRSGLGWSIYGGVGSGGGGGGRNSLLFNHNEMPPPSPCPSEQPFSSASSSLSEGSSSHRSHEDDISLVYDSCMYKYNHHKDHMGLMTGNVNTFFKHFILLSILILFYFYLFFIHFFFRFNDLIWVDDNGVARQSPSTYVILKNFPMVRYNINQCILS